MTDNKINTLLVSHFAEHLLSIGALNEKDLHSKQRLAEKIIKYARRTEFVSVTDHTEELLVWAKEFSESGNLDLAILASPDYRRHPAALN
ncbi:MAG: hypothetical protein H6962_06520 [Chromatiaceae bacterium]|nr:hypothetical protein [Chromatiaceae bacterium]